MSREYAEQVIAYAKRGLDQCSSGDLESTIHLGDQAVVALLGAILIELSDLRAELKKAAADA